MKKILFGFQLFLCGIGLIGALNLGYTQFLTGTACPNLGPVPACYIMLGIFVGLFVGTLFMNRWKFLQIIFALCLIAALYISSLASFKQITVGNTCPLSEGGIPLCYFASTLFISILILSVLRYFYFTQK